MRIGVSSNQGQVLQGVKKRNAKLIDKRNERREVEKI